LRITLGVTVISPASGKRNSTNSPTTSLTTFAPRVTDGLPDESHLSTGIPPRSDSSQFPLAASKRSKTSARTSIGTTRQARPTQLLDLYRIGDQLASLAARATS
jgi:hypothetical protein